MVSSAMKQAIFTLVGAAGLLVGGTATSKAEEGGSFERDRAAILGMVGEFRVEFNFEETVSLVEGYALTKPYHEEALELVKLVEDRGKLIVLQHILLADDGLDVHVVKHWGQIWKYEDAVDHGGQVVAGYQADESVTNLAGESLYYPMNARYPWKLAPYVGSMARAVVFNGNEKLLQQDEGDYRVSVSPNLGVNAVFVGGHFGSGSPLPPSRRMVETFGKFYVTTSMEVEELDKAAIATVPEPGAGLLGVVGALLLLGVGRHRPPVFAPGASPGTSGG